MDNNNIQPYDNSNENSIYTGNNTLPNDISVDQGVRNYPIGNG